MEEISMIGLDLAKNVFQVHGADRTGHPVVRKKLRRGQVLESFAKLPRCVVAMEACASAHYWGREIGRLGHEVRLIHPAYVKPFVKRQKNDMADAEAICEAASRPTMRFVAVKSEETQASAMVLRARELLVRQRTQLINAVRGHLGELGQVAPQGAVNIRKLVALVDAGDSAIPNVARECLERLISMLGQLDGQIKALDAEIARRARSNEMARRLMTVPGIGPLIATALVALAPPPETFRRGRDFAAWLGLVPRQHSTGGKQRLGATTKMGERSLRRLLIISANSVVLWQPRDRTGKDPWLARMIECKPPLLVRVALANKIARIVWALMSAGEVCQAPAANA